MAYWTYNPAQYARCRVNKTRWFWVVFDSFEQELYLQSDVYGYEKTAAAAEARAAYVAGPGARKTYPGAAALFLVELRHPSRYWRRPSLPAWCVTLGLKLPCGIDEVKTAYRRLAKAAHPDAGGKAEAFVALETAYREGLKHCERVRGPLAS